MLSSRTTLIKAGLEGCYLTGAHHLARPYLGGLGAILTLHHVKPKEKGAFQPNRILEITPDFLEQTILRLRDQKFDIVDLDEAARRLADPGSSRKFVVFTFDDGYRDVKEFAYPILKKHECPFTIYIPTSFPDGTGVLWWRALEYIIGSREAVRVDINNQARTYITGSLEEKYEAYNDLYWWLRELDDKAMTHFMEDFCARYRFDMRETCRSMCMNWSEIAELASDPLVTIGAHTVDHVTMSKADNREIEKQVREGARILEAALGEKPKHFSYPYGNRSAASGREFALAASAGFSTAVTTRPGILYAEHAQHMHALPRVSLNGEYQSVRYLDVLLSGLPFYVWNGFERVNLA